MVGGVVVKGGRFGMKYNCDGSKVWRFSTAAKFSSFMAGSVTQQRSMNTSSKRATSAVLHRQRRGDFKHHVAGLFNDALGAEA